MQIREYKTAFAETLGELDRKINALIQDGFEPFGSPYYIGPGEGRIDAPICQAMVRTGMSRKEKEEALKNSKALEPPPA